MEVIHRGLVAQLTPGQGHGGEAGQSSEASEGGEPGQGARCAHAGVSLDQLLGRGRARGAQASDPGRTSAPGPEVSLSVLHTRDPSGEHLGQRLPRVVALLVHWLAPHNLHLRVVNLEVTALSQCPLSRISVREVNKRIVLGLLDSLHRVVLATESVEQVPEGCLCGGQHEVPDKQNPHCGHGLLVHVSLRLSPVHSSDLLAVYVVVTLDQLLPGHGCGPVALVLHEHIATGLALVRLGGVEDDVPHPARQPLHLRPDLGAAPVLGDAVYPEPPVVH